MTNASDQRLLSHTMSEYIIGFYGGHIEIGDTVLVHLRNGVDGNCIGTLMELGESRSYIKFNNIRWNKGIPNGQIRRWEPEDRI